MVHTFLEPELHRRGVDLQDLWIQQYAATAHTVYVLNRLIARFGGPFRSPDLSICDFFLWRYLKFHVYQAKSRTLIKLKKAIRQEISRINRDLMERVEANFRERLQQCINENGQRMPSVIFHSCWANTIIIIILKHLVPMPHHVYTHVCKTVSLIDALFILVMLNNRCYTMYVLCCLTNKKYVT